MTLRIRSRAVAVSLVAAGVAAVFAAAPHTPAVQADDTTGAVVVAVPPTSTDSVDALPTTDDRVVFPDPKPEVAVAYPTNL